jgi:hypothetical protein
MPSTRASIFNRYGAAAFDNGAMLKPQCPPKIVVTPW